MALGLVKLTKRGRYLFAMVFAIFDLIQSLLGCATTGWSIYICIAISPNLYTEKSEVTFVFAVIGMYGTHIIVNGLLGLKICHKCYAQAEKKSTKKLLFLWILSEFHTIINVFILVVLAAKLSKHIVRSLRNSMERGVHYYLKDPTWKHAMDRMQIKLKCCGVESYKDWYEITWIDEHHINIDSDLVRELRISKTMLHLPATPWSCCNVEFPMQCFHDPFQQIESKYLWKEQPSIVYESIYNDGCLIIIKRPIEIAFTGFFLISSLLFIVQIITILISRIVYTACRNALILDDPDGIAPGWIFGRGDCGWNRGPGLAEIMGITLEEVASRIARMDNKASSQSSGKLLKSFKLGSRRKGSLVKIAESEDEPVPSDDEAALMLQ